MLPRLFFCGCRCGAALAVVAATALLLGGCAPRGHHGGRADPYATMRSDIASTRASMPDLYQLSDQTAEALAREIADIPEISGSPTRVVLELGDLRNDTNTPTSDFEMIQNRLRSRLRSSPLLREHVMFVESGARMDRELRRITGPGSRDLLQEGRNAGGTARYDPAATYVLQGDFQESGGGNVRRYFFNFQLVNLATREIMFNQPFDSAMIQERYR